MRAAARSGACAVIVLGAACASPPALPPESPLSATIGAAVGARNGNVVVTAVSEPARQAGLRVGDVVRTYEGAAITSARQLERLILGTPPGAVAGVEVLRGGEVLRLQLRAVPIDTTPRV